MAQSKDKIVWFGMKLSPAEKDKIKKLAKIRGGSQKEVVMGLVESSLQVYEAAEMANKVSEQVAKYAGVIDEATDLSSNKAYLDGYGSGSLS